MSPNAFDFRHFLRMQKLFCPLPRYFMAICAASLMTFMAAGANPELEKNTAAKTEAARVFEETGVKGGFVVHLGSDDARLTAALQKNSSYQVQGLERDAKKVTTSREWLLSQKIYGNVSVDLW